jgi:hypothetical protein
VRGLERSVESYQRPAMSDQEERKGLHRVHRERRVRREEVEEFKVES